MSAVDPSGLIFAALVALVCFGPSLVQRHRAGDIGPAREIEFEPFPETAPEPVRTPTPTPEPVKEPAHV